MRLTSFIPPSLPSERAVVARNSARKRSNLSIILCLLLIFLSSVHSFKKFMMPFSQIEGIPNFLTQANDTNKNSSSDDTCELQLLSNAVLFCRKSGFIGIIDAEKLFGNWG